MANVHIRSSECAWQHAELKILGRTVKGLRGWEFKKSVEKEHLYGSGSDPIDIQSGNKKCEGNVKVLGFEVDAFNRTARAAGFADITEVPHESILITIKFQKTLADPKEFVSIRGVSFSEMGGSMEQGAKMRETTLPYLAMDINQETL